MDRVDALTRLKLAMKTLREEQRQDQATAEQERAPRIASASVRPGRLWRTSGRSELWEAITAAHGLIVALRPGVDPAEWQTAESAANEALEAFRRRHDEP